MRKKKQKYRSSIATLIAITMLVLGVAPLNATEPVLDSKSDKETTLQEARTEGMIWILYAVNEHLWDDTISVEVNEETAVLTGHVDNDLEKALAKQLALGMNQIDEVENKLMVGTKNKKDTQPSGLIGLLDNASTTAAIKTKLLWNKDIAGTKIDVDTTDDVVVLTGKVHSKEAAEMAVELAKDTSGVSEVRNQLKVVDMEPTNQQKLNDRLNEAGSEMTDAWIVSATKATLMYSDKIKGSDINVDCEEGIVSLKGEVKTDLHRDLAVAMTKNIAGVKKVDASELSTH